MKPSVIVTEREQIQKAVSDAVRRTMLATVPDAIREANTAEWLGRDEVCKRYGLTPRQLTYMRKKRDVEFTQHGRRILYNRESLEGWIDAGKVTPKNDSQK